MPTNSNGPDLSKTGMVSQGAKITSSNITCRLPCLLQQVVLGALDLAVWPNICRTRASRIMKTLLLLKTATKPHDTYTAAGERRGLRVDYEPVLEHRATNESALRDTLPLVAHGDYSGLIVTSQRAIEALATQIAVLPPSIAHSLLSQTQVWTVGTASAQALRALGFVLVGGEESGHGALMAEEILATAKPQQKPLLFLVGEIRKDIVHRALAAAHCDMQELVVYATNVRAGFREALRTRLQRDGKAIGWVGVFSPQGTEEALQELALWAPHVRLVVIGPTTREFMEKLGHPPDAVARRPQADAFMDAVCEAEPLVSSTNTT